MFRRLDLSRLLPPGYEGEKEWNTALWGVAVAAFLALVGFLARAGDARSDLFYIPYEGAERILYADAVMADFSWVVGGSLLWLRVEQLYALLLTIPHYRYFYKGSKSIYLMRRLPSRWELHKRCLALPLLAVILASAVALLLKCLFFVLYLLFTPGGCLPPDAIQQFWRILL